MRRAIAVLLVPLVLACDTTEPEIAGDILIGEAPTHVVVGTEVQLTATVLSTTGSVMSGHPVTWTSAPESVATVSQAGLVTTLTPGTVTIRSTSGAASAAVTLTVAAGPCTEATEGTLTMDQTVSGTLGPTDCTLFDVPAQGWAFEPTSDAGFRITMTSTAFQPEMILTDRQLNIVMWSSWTDQGVQLAGRLSPGQYIVWAGGHEYGEPAFGGYQISVSAEDFCTAESATTAISPGESHSGVLGETDCLLPHSVRGVGFRLDLAATTGLRLDLSSPDFEPLIVVTDADLIVHWYAEGGVDATARLERMFPAGEFYVWVTGFEPGTSGAFQLSAEEVEIPICDVVGDIAIGESVSGALSTTDCVVEDAWFNDPWRLVVESESSVRIDLASSQFDTYLVLEDAAGILIAQDDDSGGNFNSRLIHTLAPGEYRVVATSFSGQATGAYTLSVQSAAGTAAASMARSVSSPRPQWLKAAARD